MVLALEKLKKDISDERKSWPQVQALRESFTPEIFGAVQAKSQPEALERAVDVVHSTLKAAEAVGVDYENVCPGHGRGHIMRDYVNALTLLSGLDTDPKHLFVGFVGGVLHDMGSNIVPRYDDATRAVRHGEAGALFLQELFAQTPSLGLNDAEKIAITYSVAAHTHYPRADEVTCSDGVTRTVEPYTELDSSKEPVWGIWLPRWVDRLDCNGPCSPARHYLTQLEDHRDYDGKSFFKVKFEDHLKPLLRPREEQQNPPRTMLEHIQMFANSQNNNSLYGVYDFGRMVELRDAHTERLQRIIDATQNARLTFPLDKDRPRDDTGYSEEMMRGAFISLLANNIEPTQLGRKTAEALDSMFSQLPDKTRQAWLNGFFTMMDEYKPWAKEKIKQLEALPYNNIYELPTVCEDVRTVLQPAF